MPPKNLVSNEEENLIDQRKIKNEKIAPAEFNTYYPQNSKFKINKRFEYYFII